jgi:hypothetical protein
MANEEILDDGEIEKKIMEGAAAIKAKRLKDEEKDEVEEGELPPALKKAIDKKKGKDDDDDDDEEEVEEAKSSNKDVGAPDIDPKTGRSDSEPDGEENKKKQKAPKTKKSDASPKAEGKMSEIDAMIKDGKSAEEIAKELKLDLNAVKKTLKSYKEEIEVNVDEDVAALVDGEELSEEFKTKAATIFEAAVKSKIANIRKQIREESKKEQDERIDSMQEEMTESMDNYLNYAVKEWMEENKLAVDTGVRNEITESFISGLKKLFEEHYIDVPDEKEDVFENLVVEVAELETKLDESTQKHMDMVKELNTYKAKDIFKTVSEGMVDTDVEKFIELTEDVDYNTDEQYAEKLNVIKNSYFKSDSKVVTDNKKTAGTNNPVVDGKSENSYMDGIMKAISNHK